MFGVYKPAGDLVGHFATAGDASRVALELGEGARVTSAECGYVVRDGRLRLVVERQAPAPVMPRGAWTAWELRGSHFAAEYLAIHAGSLN